MYMSIETLGGSEDEITELLAAHTNRLADEYCRLSDEQGVVLDGVLEAFTAGTLSMERQDELTAKYQTVIGELQTTAEKLDLLYDFFNTPQETRVC